jgi:deoxyribodipyrimidine photo-lyase
VRHQIELSGLVEAGKQCPFPPAQSAVGKFWRCGPHRTRFLAQSVWDLKDNLEAHGSGLIIRAGDPVQILDSLFQHLKNAGGMKISAVWMTEDVAYEEVREQDSIAAKCAELGVDFKLCPDEKYFIDEYEYKSVPFICLPR